MKEYVVRIVEPSNKPFLKIKPASKIRSAGKKYFNILVGSVIGMAAGLATYTILNMFGLPLGNLESSVIIGFPALLGFLTSFSIF